MTHHDLKSTTWPLLWVTTDSAQALLDLLLRWLIPVGCCRLGILPYLFLQHALQRLPRPAVRERREVVVICGQLEQPLCADLRHRTDICSGREHEFVEENPLGLGIETARRVQRYRLIKNKKKVIMHISGTSQAEGYEPYLVILYGDVGTSFLPLLVRNLQKEPTYERLLNVQVMSCLIVV